MVIVVHPPAIHNVPSLGQAQEQLAVEAFIPQFAVEALDVPVLPRASWFDEQRSDLFTPQPLLHGFRGELRSVVATKESRTTTNGEQVLQDFDNVSGREVAPSFDRQAFPRVFVHHAQQTQSSATYRPVAHEVVAPDMVLAQRLVSMTGIDTIAQSPAFSGFSADLKPLDLPQSMYSLDVHTPAIFAKQRSDSTVAEPWPLQRQSMHLGYQAVFFLIDLPAIPLSGSRLPEDLADPTFGVSQSVPKNLNRLP